MSQPEVLAVMRSEDRPLCKAEIARISGQPISTVAGSMQKLLRNEQIRRVGAVRFEGYMRPTYEIVSYIGHEGTSALSDTPTATPCFCPSSDR